MNNAAARFNVRQLTPRDSRFDFEAAQRFIELIRGDADCIMQFRALSESSEAKSRLKDLTPEELTNKRRNYPGTL